MNTYTSSRLIVVTLFILAAVVALPCSRDAQARTWRVPDTIEAFGAFELVTRGNQLAGTDYALRYRGALFEFVGKSGMFGDKTARYKTFNAVLTFVPNAAGAPTILVNVGDPNNDSFFYLLRDVDGKAEARYVGPASSGHITAQWIDTPAAGITNVWDDARHRGRLAGGRWLLVGEYTALDMQTLAVYALKRPEQTSVNDQVPVIAMAPDKLSFVRLCSDHQQRGAPCLVTFELTTGAAAIVPIRHRVERFNVWDDINLAWFNYYYQWQSRAGLPDRLIARPNVKPLPFHGDHRVSSMDRNSHEYQLTGVDIGMRDALLAHLLKAEGGTRLPDPIGGGAHVSIGGKTVKLTPQENVLTMWTEASADSALVTQIGIRFDAVLATGVHDALFYP
jgi:hypothetical protein